MPMPRPPAVRHRVSPRLPPGLAVPSIASPVARLAAVAVVIGGACAFPGTVAGADGAARPATTLLAQATDVEPVGEWLRFREIVWREGRIGLHLRTGYARPVILPEPVTLVSPAELPGCEVLIDVDVVSFEPTRDFDARPIDLVGTDSGRLYRFRVRADATGKRIPLTILLP